MEKYIRFNVQRMWNTLDEKSSKKRNCTVMFIEKTSKPRITIARR